jgi:hypothetical protein
MHLVSFMLQQQTLPYKVFNSGCHSLYDGYCGGASINYAHLSQ